MEFLEDGLLKRMLNILREGGASRTVTNITSSMLNLKKKKKKNSLTCVHRYRTAFQNANFFAGIFHGFC